MSSALSRRAFLRSTALAALAPAGCATLGSAHGNGVDAHVHVWTPDTRHFPLAPGFSVKKDMVPPSFTPDELFAQCRPQGVNRVVLIQMNFYGFDNSYLLDSVARHPHAFRGVAVVDETKPEAGAIMKGLMGKGVRGFRLYAMDGQAETWSQSSGMKKMWAFAADHGLAICPLVEPEALPTVRRMCRQFPKTRVVMDHFARIGMKHAPRQKDINNLRRLAECSQAHVKISAFYALGAKKPPYMDLAPVIHALRDSFGASRLMWGSDCPFQLQDGQTYAESISLIRDRLDFLTAEDKSWMLRRTAEKVFFS